MNRSPVVGLSLLVAAIVFMGSTPAGAANLLYVEPRGSTGDGSNCDQPAFGSIQAAIDPADAGDTVVACLFGAPPAETSTAEQTDMVEELKPPYAGTYLYKHCYFVCETEQASIAEATGAFEYDIDSAAMLNAFCEDIDCPPPVLVHAGVRARHHLAGPARLMSYQGHVDFAELRHEATLAREFHTWVEISAWGDCGELDADGDPMPGTVAPCGTSWSYNVVASDEFLLPGQGIVRSNIAATTPEITLRPPAGKAVLGRVDVWVEVWSVGRDHRSLATARTRIAGRGTIGRIVARTTAVGIPGSG